MVVRLLCLNFPSKLYQWSRPSEHSSRAARGKRLRNTFIGTRTILVGRNCCVASCPLEADPIRSSWSGPWFSKFRWAQGWRPLWAPVPVSDSPQSENVLPCCFFSLLSLTVDQCVACIFSACERGVLLKNLPAPDQGSCILWLQRNKVSHGCSRLVSGGKNTVWFIEDLLAQCCSTFSSWSDLGSVAADLSESQNQGKWYSSKLLNFLFRSRTQ